MGYGESFDIDDGVQTTAPKAIPSRRNALGLTLKLVGGALVLAAGGAGARLWQTGAAGNLTAGAGFTGRRAWDAGQVSGAEGVVVAASLAASPHNSQPWKFVIADKTIDLMADDSRNLGAMDPVRREMWIGLGCAVENMVIGAQALGFTPTLNVFPAGMKSDHVARLTLFPGERTKPPEAATLTRRRTNRGPYVRAANISDGDLKAFNALAGRTASRLTWIGADSTPGKRFVQGTIDATAAIIADDEMQRDSMAWYRHDLETLNRSRDGISTLTAGMEPAKTRLVLALPSELVTARQAEYWMQATREVQLPTAPLFGLLSVSSLDDRTALVDAGRLWQRLHLNATLKGLAVQPLNQMMEMADRDRKLGRPSKAAAELEQMAGFGDSIVAFGFRIGRAEYEVEPSPRRGVDQVISR